MKPRATAAAGTGRAADGTDVPAGEDGRDGGTDGGTPDGGTRDGGTRDGEGRDGGVKVGTDGPRTTGGSAVPRARGGRGGKAVKGGGRPASGLPSGGITWRHRLRRDRTLVLMTLPAIVLLLIFNYIPLLGNIVAFQNYDVYDLGITGSPFVGFDNFTRIFDDYRFWEVLINTLVIFLTQLILFFPIPIAIALLLNSLMSTRVKAWVQAIVYLPHFFSWVLVVTVFQQMFGGAGLVAQWLREHGHEGFDLMTNPGFFKFLVTAQAVWKDAGWGVIVFLAALAAVNTDLYEAAAVDGAGRWRRMWHVTLPALRPVIALLLVLRVGSALNLDFEQILLQRDQVGAGASEILDTYIWWTGIKTGDFGYAAAAGIFKGLFSVAMVLGANKVAHMLGEQGVYSKK